MSQLPQKKNPLNLSLPPGYGFGLLASPEAQQLGSWFARQSGSLLSSPAFMGGMGLLAAGQDSRINPYQSLMQGLIASQQLGRQAQAWGLQATQAKRKMENEDRARDKREKTLSTLNIPGYTPEQLRSLPDSVADTIIAAHLNPKSNPIIEGADGYKYYSDGTRVLPNVLKPEDRTKAFNQEGDLRGEFDDATTDYADMQNAFGRVKASTEAPSAAGDLSMIFSYMKMLDPTSVVREGEQATAQNAAGVGDQIRNTYNRILQGERLTDNQRADFFDRSKRLLYESEQGYNKSRDEYSRLAQNYQLNPDNVLTDKKIYSPYARPMTDEDYNALPSGEFYIDPDDGKLYRKP